MMRLPHGTVRDVLLILGAWVLLVALFAVLRRLGLPFELRIVPMDEDYNWLLILRAPDATAQAQAFWAMNDRNPLSPWWTIAAIRFMSYFRTGHS